jgi:hypothetical protein
MRDDDTMVLPQLSLLVQAVYLRVGWNDRKHNTTSHAINLDHCINPAMQSIVVIGNTALQITPSSGMIAISSVLSGDMEVIFEELGG